MKKPLIKIGKPLLPLQQSSCIRTSSQFEKQEGGRHNCGGEMASSRSESTFEEIETADLEQSVGESPSSFFSL
jgi:hypothetical protein